MLAFLVHCCCESEKPSYSLLLVNGWIQYNDDDYIADGLFMYKYVTAAYFNENEIASFSTSPFYVYPSSYNLYGYRDSDGNPVAPYQEYADYFDPQTDTLAGKMQTFLSDIKAYLESYKIPYPSTVSANLLGSSDPKFEGDFLDFMNNNFSSAVSNEIDKSKVISDNQDEDYRFSGDKASYIINF